MSDEHFYQFLRNGKKTASLAYPVVAHYFIFEAKETEQ